MQELFPRSEVEKQSKTETDVGDTVPVLPASHEFVVHSSSDDLRSGSYQYVMDHGKVSFVLLRIV